MGFKGFNRRQKLKMKTKKKAESSMHKEKQAFLTAVHDSGKTISNPRYPRSKRKIKHFNAPSRVTGISFPYKLPFCKTHLQAFTAYVKRISKNEDFRMLAA